MVTVDRLSLAPRIDTHTHRHTFCKNPLFEVRGLQKQILLPISSNLFFLSLSYTTVHVSKWKTVIETQEPDAISLNWRSGSNVSFVAESGDTQ